MQLDINAPKSNGTSSFKMCPFSIFEQSKRSLIIDINIEHELCICRTDASCSLLSGFNTSVQLQLVHVSSNKSVCPII